MFDDSDHSSDSEKNVCDKKKRLSLRKFFDSDSDENESKKKLPHRRGIVDGRRQTTPVKQSLVATKDIKKTNEFVKLECLDKEQIEQNFEPKLHYNRDAEVCNAKIKVEQYSSESEHEDVSSFTTWAKNTLSNDQDVKTAVNKDQKPNINKCDFNNDFSVAESENNLYKDHKNKPPNQCLLVVKEELMLSNNNETSDQDDFDTSEPEFRTSQQKVIYSSDEYDNNIPLTQIIPSQQDQQINEEVDDTRLVKISKILSPVENLDYVNDVENEPHFFKESESDSEKKPPRNAIPKVTKTKIISKNSKRKSQISVNFENLLTKNKTKSTCDEVASIDEGKGKKKIIASNECSSSSKSDERTEELNDSFVHKRQKSNNLGTGRNKLQKRKLNSSGEAKSPIRIQTSQKKKSDSKFELSGDNSNIESKRKMNKKAASNQNSENLSSHTPLMMRPSICDKDTSSETEEDQRRQKTKRKETSQNCISILGRSETTKRKNLNSEGMEMAPKGESDNQSLENSTINNKKTNISVKHQSMVSQSLITRYYDTNKKYSTEDKSHNSVSNFTTEKSSKNKRKYVSSSSDEEGSSTKRVAINHKEQLIKPRQLSVPLPPPTLSGRLNSEVDSNVETVSLPLNASETSSNSHDTKSNKQAKLMSSKKIAHTMSDTDDTDSITQLNTALNKSMALMENMLDYKKPSTNGKSVSINIKHKLVHSPNDVKTQKSILKKSEYVTTPANEENVTYHQEQSVEKNVPSVRTNSEIIKRPLNLQDFEQQESFTRDSTKSSFKLQHLSDDDEIYIMDIPQTVDPKELKSQIIRLEGKNKLQIGNDLYETCKKEAKDVSCVFRTDGEQSSYRVVNIKPVGYINIRQKLLKSLHIEPPSSQKMTVPFPEKLKTRHPLFGMEWEDKIFAGHSEVSKKPTKSKVIADLMLKKNEAFAKSPNRQIKKKSIEKNEDTLIDYSRKCNNKSEINCKNEIRRIEQPHTNPSVSSDSDSDEGFFQKVKHETMGKHDVRKSFENLSSILNHDETSSPEKLSVYQTEVASAVQQEENLEENKKLGLSWSASVIKSENLDENVKNNQFFSSTPIKVNESRRNDEQEESTHKSGKKKRSINTVKPNKSPKKMSTVWDISKFEKRKKKVSK